MGKIGDLFVRLGLKKDDFQKGLNDAKKDVSGFSQTFTKIKGVAAAAWAAIGVGLAALAKDFAHHSQRFGDLWDNTVSRMKAAWGQFLTSLSNWDWNGFGKRIGDAMSAAGRSQAAHDAEFEVENSIRLKKADMAADLERYQVEMRNAKLSAEKRAEYAKKYLDAVKPLYKQEEDLRNSIYITDTDEYLANAGLKKTTSNRDALNKFLTDIAPNATLVAILDEYNKRNQGKNYKLSAEELKVIDKLFEGSSYNESAALTVLASYYQGSGNEEASKVVDAIEKYKASKGAFDKETRRVQQVLNAADASSGIDTKAIKTSAEEVKTEADLLKEALQKAGGNVNLLNRPLIEGADLVARGWEDAGNKIQTIYSQIAQTTNASGESVDILVTPILSNGQILSPEQLQDYILTNLKGAEDMLAADKLGIVLQAGVEVNEGSQRALESLVSQFYAGDIAVQNWTNQIREGIEAEEEFQRSLEELEEQLQKEIDAEFQAQMDEITKGLEEAAAAAEDMANRFGEAVAAGFSDGCQEIFDQLLGLEEYNVGAVVQAFLDPLAKMAIQMGEIIVAEGVAMAAAKAALKNPYTAIAAGAALIAIGTAAHAALSAVAASGGGTSSAGTYQGETASNRTETIETEMTIYVKGQISGNDIVLSGQRTISNNSR